MIDRYTKIVLTVIAVSLSVLAIGQLTPKAHAQSADACGAAMHPCYITTLSPLRVKAE